MKGKASRPRYALFSGLLMAALLISGLNGCDQAPTPPPFRPYEEPEPFEPPETAYTLDKGGERSVELSDEH